MEDKDRTKTPGVGDEVPEAGYLFAPRAENAATYAGAPMQAASAPQATLTPPPGFGTGSEVKKKRGRPRKYAADGSLAKPISPMPISSSIPLTGEFSAPLTGDFPAWKQGKGGSVDSVIKKSQKYEHESSSGERIAYSVGADFTPHVITVNTGEDVQRKVMSFPPEGSRAICILSANGFVSSVTLRQPSSSGGTLTHQGRFEILSLSGSFMPTENAGPRSRSGGMSVSLVDPNGRVLGGGLAGLLVAEGPVQVVVGSFQLGHQQEHKKQRTEPAAAAAAAAVVSSTAVHTMPTEGFQVSYGGVNPILTSTSFHGDSSGALNPIPGFYAGENKSSSYGEESDSDCPSL